VKNSCPSEALVVVKSCAKLLTMSEPGIVKHDRALGAIDPKPTVFQ
jgi:hypothetical protein